MALNRLSTKGKLLKVQDGTKYAYVYVPAKDSKPTMLLLHGFPSSSYDWRHQLKSLTELGYGVLAPDLLGYGDTDRPTEIEKYKFKQMVAHVTEILDKESLKTVIGVAHDWLSALVFTSVPYIEPGSFDLDAINAMTEQIFGYPCYGYQKFFCEDDAASICDKNYESLTSLLYPSDPGVWRTDLSPYGAAKAWVSANTIKPPPVWLSASEINTHNDILKSGGYEAPLNWYKATVRGYQTDDDAQIPEERKFVDAPTLVIISDQDYATRAEMAEQIAPARLRNFSIKKLTGCGHWIQLEKRDEFSEALVQFAVEVSGKV